MTAQEQIVGRRDPHFGQNTSLIRFRFRVYNGSDIFTALGKLLVEVGMFLAGSEAAELR